MAEQLSPHRRGAITSANRRLERALRWQRDVLSDPVLDQPSVERAARAVARARASVARANR